MEYLGGEIRVAEGYVFVRNPSVPDRRRAREILSTVDLALERSGYRSVLFDTRDMPGPPEDVNEILRHWVDARVCHDRVALLVKSDMKRVASNMRALAVKVNLRSFHELEAAEDWLRAPVPRPRERTEPVELPRRLAPEPRRVAPETPSVPQTLSDRDARAARNREFLEAADRAEGREPEPDKGEKRFQWRSPLLREHLGD